MLLNHNIIAEVGILSESSLQWIYFSGLKGKGIL